MKTVVEIEGESCGISVNKGFLLVRRGEEASKIPLSEIEALIIFSHGAYITNQALARLSAEGVPIVHCGGNAQPCALTLPYGSNVYRKQRIACQIAASEPLRKNLWRQVVISKISNQARVLQLCGKACQDLDHLAGKVLSGDTGNCEATAARFYWERLFEKGFKRDPDLPGINAHLNYGYAVLRASFCRHLVAAGFIPELGIHHRNQMDPYCLADDLMEPFRPFTDLLTHAMGIAVEEGLCPERKRQLVSLLDLPLQFNGEDTRLRYAIQNVVEMFARSLEQKKPGLAYPRIGQQTLDWVVNPLL